MNKRYLKRILTLIMLSLLFLTGCSSLKPVYGDSFHISRLKPRNTSHVEKSSLKIKVLAAPLVNMAGLDEEKTAMLTETWTGLLKEDASLLVTTLTGFESPGSDISYVETGIVNDPELINKAEEMGMNILVTSVLEPLNYTVERGIIWPFNKFKGEYEVSMVAGVIDASTGTLIFPFKESERIKMGEVPERDKTPVPLDPEILDNVLHELQERLSTEILELLEEQGWEGKISMEDGKIRISGGADIGITAGDVFNVFAKGETIKSMSGRDYYTKGPKAGEIRVTDVMGDYSLAVPVGKDVFETGQIIALRSE